MRSTDRNITTFLIHAHPLLHSFEPKVADRIGFVVHMSQVWRLNPLFQCQALTASLHQPARQQRALDGHMGLSREEHALRPAHQDGRVLHVGARPFSVVAVSAVLKVIRFR
jgi:hypothetical protein